MKELRLDYHQATKRKKKNSDCVTYQLHKCRNLRRLRSEINEAHLHPTSATYIVLKPIVREVYSADVSQCIVEHRLERYLRPLMEDDINSNVFNNRKEMGLDRALNHLIEDIYDVTNGYTTNDGYIIVTDINGYFPNAIQDRMYTIMERLIKKSDYPEQLKSELIYMLRMSVYFDPRKSEKRSPEYEWNYLPPRKSLRNKPPGIGAAPGRIIMQMIMTYYHNSIIREMNTANIKVTVYGDDMAFVVNRKEQFLRLVMPVLRKKMEEIGCRLHPDKFYCQHYTKGVRFCSQSIKLDRLYPGNRIVNNYMQAIRRWSVRPTLAKIPSMTASLNSYIGTLKNRNGYAIIIDGLSQLNPEWLPYVYLDKDNNTLRVYPYYNRRHLINRMNNLIS